MKIKTVYTSSLCPDAVFMALEIIKRMGWCHDEPDENGDMLVSIPIEDEHLFDFWIIVFLDKIKRASALFLFFILAGRAWAARPEFFFVNVAQKFQPHFV